MATDAPTAPRHGITPPGADSLLRRPVDRRYLGTGPCSQMRESRVPDVVLRRLPHAPPALVFDGGLRQPRQGRRSSSTTNQERTFGMKVTNGASLEPIKAGAGCALQQIEVSRQRLVNVRFARKGGLFVVLSSMFAKGQFQTRSALCATGGRCAREGDVRWHLGSASRAPASSILAVRHSHQHASGDSQRAVVEPAHEIVGRRHRPITVG